MDEAILCDRIGLMQNGRLLTVDTPINISNSFQGKIFSVTSANVPSLLKLLSGLPGASDSYAFGQSAHLVIKEGTEETDIISYLENAKAGNVSVSQIVPTVEDSFIRLLKS
jgi:ABC-2 type transport system ATP-binding protein